MRAFTCAVAAAAASGALLLAGCSSGSSRGSGPGTPSATGVTSSVPSAGTASSAPAVATGSGGTSLDGGASRNGGAAAQGATPASLQPTKTSVGSFAASAAAGGSVAMNPTALASMITARAAMPGCSTMFVDGGAVTATGASLQCKDPKGTIVLIGLVKCKDGRSLGSVPASTGALLGWFVSPGPYHAVQGADVAADAGYAAASRACTG